MLARIIRTGNYEVITGAIDQFNQLPIPDDYNNILDKANLPFLIDFFASNNEAAQRLIQDHRDAKSVQMASEIPIIVKDFYDGTMKNADEGYIQNNLFPLLTTMISTDDSNYVHTGLQILNNLEFDLEDLESLVPKLNAIRESHSEADRLIQKIEAIQLQFDDADEDLELDVENDEDDDVDQDSEDDGADSLFSDHDDHNESFLSIESGFESGYEDEEEEEAAEQQYRNYMIATTEVHAYILSSLIKTGDPRHIALGIELISELDFTLFTYRKYEIASLIREHASHCEEAIDLLNQIDRLDDVVLADDKMQTFDQIVQYIDSQPGVSMLMMDILADYLMNESRHYMDQVVQILIEKQVPLEQFKEHGVKKYLLEYPEKNENIWILILKIRDLERF
uniref:HEAT repeat domain-containing protein n=1 Tax=Caenorhabditis tropicalis TaxID=1561998 RepID=A0A1I7T4V8_9PELO